MIFDEILNSIEDGRQGKNAGIPMGFPRFSEVIPNIQKGRYHLVVGESGSGKSAFVDTAYVFNPLEWYMKNKNETNIKLKIFYYSFEISKDRLITKQIARKLFTDYNLLLDPNYILSFGKNRISQEHYDLVTRYKDYFYQLEEFLEIKDSSTTNNPTGVNNDLNKWAQQNGKFEMVNNQNTYFENDSNLVTLTVLDHMAIQPKERGFDTKQNMDKMSEYTVNLRNKCKFSFTYLVQANRNLGNIERLKYEKSELSIKQADIKDSSNPGADSDAIIGIFNPWKYNIDEYRGYNIANLRGRQRFLNVAKNRDGDSDGTLGLLFLGECGYFKELPKKDEMNDQIYTSIANLRSSKK